MNGRWPLLLAAVLLCACQDVTYSNERLERIQAELTRRYGLWKKQAIPSYEYRFSRSCPCPESLTRTVVVSVADSVLVGAVYADSGTAVPDSALGSYFTVEGLFLQVQIAVNIQADSIVVDYDPLLHYPMYVKIDQDVRRLQDELVLSATEFKKK